MKFLLAALAFVLSGAAVAIPHHLVLFGGGELSKTALDRFVALAGGERAHVLVITWASVDPPAEHPIVQELRSDYHLAALLIAPTVDELAQAPQRAHFQQQLKEATAVFFGGGSQDRIVDTADKWEFREPLRAKFAAGIVFGGTSAGTAVTGNRMPTGEVDAHGHSVTMRGLGLLPPSFFVDMHFLVRQREARLRDMLAHGPETVGLGVDEGSAIEVTFDSPERIEVTQRGPSHLVELAKDGDAFCFHTLNDTQTRAIEAKVDAGQCEGELTTAHGETFHFYQSQSLRVPDAKIQRAVIVVHGMDRNADEYFATMVDAAKAAGKSAETLVLAPAYKTAEDPGETRELRWQGGWKYGEDSGAPTDAPPVSSFALIDQLVQRLSDKKQFPSLNKIVITGHSAGGQFLSRYAFNAHELTGAAPIRYAIVNPSSYLYLDARRPAGDGFAVPQAAQCSDYDEYAYGARGEMPPYVRSEKASWVARLQTREIALLLGEADLLSEDLDTSCEANFEGLTRYERGLHFYDYLQTFAPRAVTKLTVPGVGHDHRAMYLSSQGLRTVFGD